MARLGEKPNEMRQGDPLGASRINAMIRGGVREVAGAGGADVEQFGDRYLIRQGVQKGNLPDITNYLVWVVVLKEYDDVLLCAKYDQPHDDTTWTPYSYSPSLGAQSQVTFYVAKPIELQRVAWDGLEVPGDSSRTYSYGSTVGERSVIGTTTVDEVIDRPYAPGDLLYCSRGVTGLKDPNGVDVFWADLNVAARRWEGGDVEMSSYCRLAALMPSDCLTAAGPSNSVVLRYDNASGKWTSSDLLTYPGSSGTLVFWRDTTLVKNRLTLTIPSAGSGSGPGVALDLMECPTTGCWVGGPLTGHVAAAEGSCTGQTFSVCLSCVECPEHVPSLTIACCPGVLLPPTLYAKLETGDGVGDTVLTLTYVSGANAGWYACDPCEFFNTCVWGLRQDDCSFRGNNCAVPTLSIDCDTKTFTYQSPSGNDSGCLGLLPVCFGSLGSSLKFTVTTTSPSGGGSVASGCTSGDCGDAGVPATLTATVTSATGVYASLPSSFTMTCHDLGGAAGHDWISGTSYTLGTNTGTIFVYYSVVGGIKVPSIALPGATTTPANAGWTCSPSYGAVFYVTTPSGSSCTITVTG